MALINDPDLLSQGTVADVSDMVFASTAGAVTTISSVATELPSISAGDYFEVRGNSDPDNNGLYVESGGSPTTGSITATKLAGDGGANPADNTTDASQILHADTTLSTEKSVYIDVYNREVWLIKQGNLSTDGVTLQALYSFCKEEWKNDATLIPHPFPFVAITPEQFEVVDDWVFHTGSIGPGTTTETRKLIRTGGWREVDAAGTINREYPCVITLGNFEDNGADLAYYQQGNDPTDTTATVDFTFAGPVNESVLSYDYITTDSADAFVITTSNTITRTSGSWLTEGYRVGGRITIVTSDTGGNLGTYTISSLTGTVLTVTGTPLTNDADDATFTSAVNNRNVLNVFLRIRDGDLNGKTFDDATLTDIGVTDVDNKVFRFPLTNSTDLKIEETDTNIQNNSPYTQIGVKFFDQAYTKDVDDPTGSAPRSFGIVVDVGTFSGVDGSSAGSTTFSTAEAGIPGTTYDGGILTIHEGADKGDHTISSATGGTVTLSSALTGTESNLSFTLQRATPVTATAEEIYEKVQYLLRQAVDIDDTDQGVTGKTADSLLRFVGETLEAGQATPTNPNGGGSGVIIEGFSANDTNRLTFYDNTATDYTFPFVAAGAINFNNNLQNDTDAKYWMFFQYTTRTTATTIAVTAPSGSSATITSSGNDLPALTVGDYVNIQGFANEENNGVWRITSYTNDTTMDAYRVNGDTVVAESAGATVTIDENPIDSPDAIIVNNNVGSPITGDVSAQSSVSFDFDYDNNSQGGRTPATNAAIIIRAIGFDTAQFVETTGTITRNTGLTFSLVSSLERNYSNPV